MSRPVDWSPLGRGSDPVAGDPVRVATMGAHYTEVAEAIATSAANLRRIAAADDGQTSKAIDAFRERAGGVADDITRAHERYAGVGVALSRYAPFLDEAQQQSVRALTAARTAREDMDNAASRTRSAQTAVDAAADEAAAAPHATDLSNAQRDATSAYNALQTAENLLHQAESLRDEKAEAAARSIDLVDDSGDLNDGWWDNHGAKIVAFISEVAGWVSLVCGILALAVGWIPIIGQALAAVLGTIALVAAVVQLVCNLALYFTGYGSLGDVLLAAFSVATFGIGRIAGAAARVGRSGALGAGRIGAGRLAAMSASSRAAAGAEGLSGSSRTVLRALSGSDEVAGITKSAAGRMASGAGRMGRLPSPAQALTSLRGLRTQFVDDLGTIMNRGNWGQALGGLRPGQLPKLGGAPGLLSHAVGEGGAAREYARIAAIHPAAMAAGNASTYAHVASTYTGVLAGATGLGVLGDVFGGDVLHAVTAQPIEMHLPEGPAIPNDPQALKDAADALR